MKTSSSLTDKIKALSPDERARLALTLIESLDPGTDEDAEELWLEEAERRLAELDAGTVRTRLATEVLAEIKAKHQ